MKKILMIIVIIFLANLALAQNNKGKWSVGAHCNYYNNKITDEDSQGVEYSSSKNTNGNYDFSFGHFFSNNFILGIKGIYIINSYNNSNEPFATTMNSHTIDAGLFTRYYHMFNESKFGYFVELNATYTFGSNKTEQNNYSSSYPSHSIANGDISGYKVSLFPGIVYYLHPKIALETSIAILRYSKMTTDITTTTDFTSDASYTTEHNDGVTASLSINSISLGVSYYFGKGKN